MTMPASAEKIQFLEDRLSRLSSRRVGWVCYQRTRSVDTMKSGRAMRVTVFGAGILLWFNP